ncbi:MAG: M36 family metallopeptidase [Deltaproteobacteria bacterium]|nr:M36 family metallopeptidase [Deltaproteobacteria bacterium]
MALAILFAAGSAFAIQNSGDIKPEGRNFDARNAENANLQVTVTEAQRSAEERLRVRVPELDVRYSNATGAARTVYNRVGYLTDPSTAAPLNIGLNFTQQNLDLFGLTTADLADYEITDSVFTQVTGAHHIYLRQTHAGIPLYNGQMQFNVNRNGHIISINNNFLPDLASAINTQTPATGAGLAVEQAAQQLGLDITKPPRAISTPEGVRQVTHVDASGLSTEPVVAQLMWMPIRQGEARLTWNFQLSLLDGSHWYDLTVDAVTGQIWTALDWIADDQYKVYEQPIVDPDHTTPAPPADARTIAVDPHDTTASPFGWHDTDGVAGAEFTIPRGNNVHAYEDSNTSNGPPAVEPDCGAGIDCDFPLDLTMAPSTYRDAAAANLFYWNNIIHDILYFYGFDEAGGNFQVNNYGNGGLGNDDVQAEAQDGGGNCNANFGTPPDGSRPRMQMFTCTNVTPARDGDLDHMVIVHEYGHGISNRQVGGPSNTSCLGNTQQAGEGWSDWYGLVYTADASDLGTDARGVGTWLFGQASDGPGIRDQPYSTDPAVNTWTYEDIAGAAVPHGVGSRWAQATWDVYWALVDEHGFDADLYNALGGSGNQRALLYINEGLKDTACGPSFLDSRDGVIQAAMDNYGGEDVCLVWEAFAAFGLGVDATTPGPNSTSATNGFNVPGACSFLGADTTERNICAGDDAVFPVVLGTAWTPPVNLSASGNPGGTTTAFSLNPVPTVPNNSELTVGSTGGAAAGSYVVTVNGDDTTNTIDLDLDLNVFAGSPGAASLTAPTDGATGVAVSPQLEWAAVADTVDYLVEVATDSGFANIIYSATESGTSNTLDITLDPVTEYFWRVTANNPCGAGAASSTFSFTTANLICSSPSLAIPDSPGAPAVDTLVVSQTGTIDGLTVQIRADHTWVGDLIFTLTHSDTGTAAALIDRPGRVGSGFGCSGNDIDATMDDNGASPVEDECDSGVPTINGTFSPNNPLAAFDGEDISGTWTMSVEDEAGGDTGDLVEWCLVGGGAVSGDSIFADGFESGDTSAWSLTFP